jgi:hypothetical protein
MTERHRSRAERVAAAIRAGASRATARSATTVMAVLVHVLIVASILAQPLDVNRHEASERSVIWSLHNDTVHRRGPAADLFAIYHAGRMLETGADPYGFDGGSTATYYFYGFRYLPIVAQTVGRFLTLFSPKTAWVIWALVMETVLAGLVILLWRRTGPPWLRVFLACLLLLASPFFLEIHMGQFTFVALALLAMSLLVLEKPMGRHVRWGGRVPGSAFLAAATLLKPLPLVTLPAFVKQRRHWGTVAVVVGILMAVSIPWFVAHPGQWTVFRASNLQGPLRGMDTGNFSLPYLLYSLLHDLGHDPSLESWHWFVLRLRWTILSCTVIVVLLSRSRSLVLGAAALIMAHFVSYAQMWEHHATGVLIMVVLLIREMNQQGMPLRHPLVVALIVASVWLALPTPFALFDAAKNPDVFDPGLGWSGIERTSLILSKALPTLVAFLCAIVLVVRAGFISPWPGGRR